MKRQDAIKAIFDDGKPLLPVTYLNAVGDVVRRRAPKQGQASEMPQVKHSVLVGDVSFEVVEWLPDGATIVGIKPLFPRFTRCLCEVATMEQGEYGNRITGKLVALEQ